jgi:foldase protein PrsA
MLGRRGRGAGVCLWLLALLLFAGCSKPVATVNGRPVDNRTFELLLKERTKEAGHQMSGPDLKKLREGVVDALITEALMLEDAAQQGIAVTDEEAAKEVEQIRKSMGEAAFTKALKDKGFSSDMFRRRTKEKMLLSRFTESLLSKEKVSDEEIRSYYTGSSRPFLKPAKILMNMIELGTEEAGSAIMRDMRANKADFDAVAKKLADEQKANVSGYGWVNPELFSPGLSLAVRNLRNGHYGGPYKGKDKYYLVKVMDREKESIASFDEVKDSIRSTLLEEKRQMAFAHWVGQKRMQAKIEVHLD